MRFFIAGLIVSSIIIFSSCSESIPEKDESLMNSVQSTKTDLPTISQPALAPVTQAAPAIEEKAPVNLAALNPEHGKPGHRCDIAVGAPLNSPAAVTTTTPAVKTINTPSINSQPIPAPVKTAAGMNPPHGEPGHRCDIAVGAPLNSPAAETAPAVNVEKPDSVGT
ncbi:MAG: hypothetical protein IPL97_01825 [Niastella sp.]|nr:hypothetical protein [Niastella sp.]